MNRRHGMTLIEVVVVLTILSILAAIAVPSARIASTRAKEMELRRALREIRGALDEYRNAKDIVRPAGSSGYPPSLEILVEGVPVVGAVNRRKFLRRVPRDPFGAEWGLRSYADPPDSETWGRQDVFDVYSRAPGRALDGSSYATW